MNVLRFLTILNINLSNFKSSKFLVINNQSYQMKY